MNTKEKQGHTLSLDKKELHPHPQKDAEEGVTKSIGAQLRQLRKEKGFEIKDIARETNISSSNLVAIEHENYTQLPAATFIRGQVAIYANFLGLNGAEAGRTFVAEWERQSKGKKKQKEGSNLSVNKLSEPTHLSTASLVIGLVVLFFLFIIGLSLYIGWNPFSSLFNRDQPQLVVPVNLPESPESQEVVEQRAEPSSATESVAQEELAQEAEQEAASAE
jgi:cytoskeletal protein RodZ